MEKRRFGIILKVNNLDMCREFYRRLLGLGDPVIDSSFAAEFAIGPDAFLLLEKAPADYLEHENSAQCWFFSPADPDRIARELQEDHYPLKLVKDEYSPYDVWRGQDPEGNTFCFAAGAAAGTQDGVHAK